MEMTFGLNVRIFTDGDTTAAILESECGCEFLGMGFAKLHPNDEYNESIGIDIATMRAIDQWQASTRADLMTQGIKLS